MRTRALPRTRHCVYVLAIVCGQVYCAPDEEEGAAADEVGVHVLDVHGGMDLPGTYLYLGQVSTVLWEQGRVECSTDEAGTRTLLYIKGHDLKAPLVLRVRDGKHGGP